MLTFGSHFLCLFPLSLPQVSSIKKLVGSKTDLKRQAVIVKESSHQFLYHLFSYPFLLSYRLPLFFLMLLRQHTATDQETKTEITLSSTGEQEKL